MYYYVFSKMLFVVKRKLLFASNTTILFITSNTYNVISFYNEISIYFEKYTKIQIILHNMKLKVYLI